MNLRLMNWEPFPFDPKRLDAVVLSHGHLDHSGALPLLDAKRALWQRIEREFGWIATVPRLGQTEEIRP